MVLVPLKNDRAGLIGMVHQDNGNAELKHIAVKAGFRGQGIGAAMISGYAKLADLKIIVAETDKNAVGFYEKLGFEIASLGEKYPGVERFQCRLKWSRMHDGYRGRDRFVE